MAALDRQIVDLTFDCGAVWQVLPLRARGGTATTTSDYDEATELGAASFAWQMYRPGRC